MATEMSARTIVSRAPTRIDLAGGTVDLWPLYLFLKKPTTINLGIDLFAEATLSHEPSKGGAKITLRSADQGIEHTFAPADFLGEEREVHPALVLHYKLLRHFYSEDRANETITISTRALSPAGAGLGGSSTLSVALIGAIAAWKGKPVEPLLDGVRFIDIVKDVETTVIQVPAGMQDYYGAMFGGLQALRWQPGENTREYLPESILGGLESRLDLFYSGQSRNSGINNWVLFKGCIDKQDGVRDKFARIAAASNDLETALRAGDWQAAGRAITAEWEARRTLAPGISTPEIDRAFAEARAIAPGLSMKICGAGGGGCFFLYNDSQDPALKQRVREVFTRAGMRHLPFKAVPRGLDVRTEPRSQG